MDEEELGSINVEIRYITLELMKIAEKRGKPFDLIAEEFVGNVKTLHKTINSSSETTKPEETKKVLNKL